MTIDTHIDQFFGMDIENFDAEQGIKNSQIAIKISSDDDNYDDTGLFQQQMAKLLSDSKLPEVQALIVGAWPEAYDESAQVYIDMLLANADKLENIKALFIGEMTYEENEISWIVQGDYARVWSAFPALTHMQIRGGQSLTLSLGEQSALKTLIVESGGLPASVVNEVATCQMPELTHLELWLGTEDYGWDGNIDTVLPLLSATKFPKLTHLAIKNSEIQSEILSAVLDSDILSQLTHINMSMGILTDADAQLLLDNKAKLADKIIDVSQNYLSDVMVLRLKENLNVITDDQGEVESYDGEDYYYVSVAE
ncbi:hypothetical protein NFHSH190041_02680 [Shewanella sp. NFH-SH190041]|uniref:STM4015 family protein n=1 Tax=Shewanella sp. NFH-SH190041 TaxID=2950245 RepID=UPI0021C3EB1F|nr:STM4015 family protein [Shewanella sp. NFH-SH190041]BDM62816.1 hypothetical protein NFHSH190041_02680 [Shewanella sp. NFH-SH190041]